MIYRYNKMAEGIVKYVFQAVVFIAPVVPPAAVFTGGRGAAAGRGIETNEGQYAADSQ